MNSKIQNLAIGLAVFITACGGGTGGGSGGGFSGTYAGTGSVTFQGAGVSSTRTGNFTLIVGANGNVTFQEGGVTIGTGTINGNQFSITLPASRFDQPAVTCSGTFQLNANISFASVNGTVSSNGIVCNLTSVTITGSFAATRTN